jgi:hypothetical protein
VTDQVPGRGSVFHYDLTVPNADEVRDFYAAVVGWAAAPLDMGGYDDYVMSATGTPVAGVCHARSGNAGFPPVWLPYVAVADLDGALDRAQALAGAVVAGPVGDPGSRYVVVRDPAGAGFALSEAVWGDAAPPPGERQPEAPPGSIVGLDLTVPDAERVREFYVATVGWKPRPVEMDGYADYEMTDPSSGATVAGICHARGTNAGLPSVWLPYVGVAVLDAALDRCRNRGGSVVAGPFGEAGSWRYAVIRDPAGAHLALSEAI